MKKILLITSVAVGLLLCTCSVLSFLGERLNVFLVNFSFGGIGISLVTPPNLLSLRLSDYGIAVNCTMNAKNDNSTRAVFDGASFMLRVNDTSLSARGVEAPFPSFSVEAGQQTTFTVPFKIMLDNPLFSKAVLQKVVTGDRIPYRVSADLMFKLLAPETGGDRGSALFGTKSVSVDLVRESVDTRPNLSSLAGKAFSAALSLVSRR
jgi:hypothetical protein